MKPKMKDSTQNQLVILNMIGQAQHMWEYVGVSDIAAWMGVSKTTCLKRLWQLVDSGYIVMIAEERGNGSMKYVVGLTENGQEWAFSGAAKSEYKSWVSKSRHVREIRIGSIKSMFI